MNAAGCCELPPSPPLLSLLTVLSLGSGGGGGSGGVPISVPCPHTDPPADEGTADEGPGLLRPLSLRPSDKVKLGRGPRDANA